MKRILKRLIPLAVAIAVLAPMFFTNSCANTTQAPTGGDKDTIPPVLVDINPLPGTTMVPVSGTKIVFTFDEFVTIKNAQSIYLSPPQAKMPKSKIHGKSLVVSFEEDLQPNTTYSIDLSDAIADNNENNQFPGFTYVFSTGTSIDSMFVTGTVRDCNTMLPVKGATVMLYKDHRDSAVFIQRPYAATRTDDWGYFSMPYIQDTLYRLYAMKDAAGNNIYEPDADLIAFCDSLVSPKYKVNDTIYELMKFDMKDTLECLARRSEYELRLFREKPTKQLIMNKKRISDRAAYITFLAPYAWIDSLWIGGIRPAAVITQFNQLQDSLEIWVNDRRQLPDTLHLFVNYRKTDTLGRLLPNVEHVKLYQENVKTKAHSRRNIKHEDTTCVFKLNAEPERVEQYGFELEFNYPIIYEKFDSIQFKYINPKQKEFKAKFTVERDSLNLRKYTLRPATKIQKGFEYVMKVPERTFRDINGFWSDSTEVKVSLPTDDELSSLQLSISNVDRKIIVDLMNEKMTEVLRSYITDKDGILSFPYLKTGKYAVRITDDGNRNSIVDTGSLLEHRQPEMVCLIKFDKSEFIDIPKASEIEQKIDLREVLK